LFRGLTYVRQAEQKKNGREIFLFQERGPMKIKKTIKTKIYQTGKHLLIVSLLAVLLPACGKDSSGSDVTRQFDHDRENADVIRKIDDSLNATYVGAINNADIVLVVTTTMVTTAGSLVPTPTLCGTLVFSPRVSVSDGQGRVKDFFPYSDGTYDQTSNTFSFTVEKEARATTVTCQTSSDTFNCSWYRRVDEVGFTLKKGSDDALKMLDTKNRDLFGGIYVGHTPEGLLVRGTFSPGLVNKPDSEIPELGVIGSIVFYSEKQTAPDVNAPQAVYPFIDGSYDVGTGVISATTAAPSGGSIIVNCTVESSQSLYCHWYAREPIDFRMYRQNLKPASLLSRSRYGASARA